MPAMPAQRQKQSELNMARRDRPEISVSEKVGPKGRRASPPQMLLLMAPEVPMPARPRQPGSISTRSKIAPDYKVAMREQTSSSNLTEEIPSRLTTLQPELAANGVAPANHLIN